MTRGTLLAPGHLTWMLGIEDTCVYPPDRVEPGRHRLDPLDEHVLTDHHLHWRADLRRAADLGAGAIRYGMSWPLVHLAPGRFDWTHLDQVVDYCVDELEIDIVADLVHYGTPRWLPDSFADPLFAGALAEFAGALAHRYAGRIRGYTPVNEPVTTASFSGLRAVWPPHRSGWDGWASVAVPIAVGATAASHAIRAADPQALIVHVEASTSVTTLEPELADEHDLLRDIGWLPTDLMLGRVDPTHPRYGWLIRHGAAPDLLDHLLARPATLDVMGVNYYPNLTPRTLGRIDGRVVQVAYDGGATRFAEVLRKFRARYGLPLAVTETSIEGTEQVRRDWLSAAAHTVDGLRDELDIRGFTWWPLLDFVDWSWAAGGANVEEFAVEYQGEDGERAVGFAPPVGHPDQGRSPFLRRMGLLHLREEPDGSLTRVHTPAADTFADLAVGVEAGR